MKTRLNLNMSPRRMPVSLLWRAVHPFRANLPNVLECIPHTGMLSYARSIEHVLYSIVLV